VLTPLLSALYAAGVETPAGPTTVVVTVGPTGRDYTSLIAAEAGEQRDLVALNEVAEIVCYGFVDQPGVSFSGWTADATRHIIVRAAAGAEAGMPWRTTGAYTLSGMPVTGGNSINVSDGRPRFIGLQIRVDAFSFDFTQHGISGADYFEVENCHIRYVGHPTNNGQAYGINNAFGGYRAVNTIVADFDSTGGGTGRIAFHNASLTTGRVIYNCTAINCLIGVQGSADFSTATVKNTLVDSRGLSGAVGFQDLGSGFGASSDYNATDLTGAPGANSRNSQNFTFVDAAGGDYRLTLDDLGARRFGTDLSADPTYPFNNDFQNRVRHASSWDIGAFQSPEVVVSQIAASGGDYTSLSAWEAAEQRDLVALNEVAVAECQAFEDTTNVVIDGWTTAADNNIEVRAAAGAEAVATGFDTSRYYLHHNVFATGTMFHVAEPFTRLIGLQVKTTGFYIGNGVNVNGLGCLIDRCRVSGDAAGMNTGHSGIGVQGGTAEVMTTVRNTVIENWPSGNGLSVASNGFARALNVTAYNCNSGFVLYNPAMDTAVFINCLGASNILEDWGANGGSTGSSNNASSDGSAPGTNSRINQAFTFRNEAAGDYRLTLDDLGARRFGLDVGATYAFSNDFEGRVRHAASWDIGAFQSPEVVVSQIAASGGDYTSLSAWESGEQKDLVTANEVAVAECQAFEDTAQVNILGWDTAEDRFIEVRAAAGAEAQVPWSNSAYRLSSNYYGSPLGLNEGHVRIRGVQVENRRTAADEASNTGIFVGGGGFILVEGCHVRRVAPFGTDASWYAALVVVSASGTDSSYVVRNNVLTGGSVGLSWRTHSTTNARVFLHNNTAVGQSERSFAGGWYGSGGVFRLRNNLGTVAFGIDGNAPDAIMSHNATASATVLGTDSRINQNFTFVDAAGGDYRLTLDDLGARRFGTDLSADPTYPFNNDLEGRVRHAASWDIGAFQSPEVVISQVAATGGDYTSLSAAEAGDQRDLVALNEVAILECQAFEDTTNVWIAGWTTAADHGVTVRAANEAARSKMPWDETAYRLRANAPIHVATPHWRFENLQVDCVAYSYDLGNTAFSATERYEVEGCYVRYTPHPSNPANIRAFSTGFGGYHIRNTVVEGFDRTHGPARSAVAFAAGSSSHRTIHNCTIIQCQTGVVGTLDQYATTTVRNTLVDTRGLSGAVAFEDTGEGFAAGSDYNATNITGAPGANSRNSQTFTFVDAEGGDYRLASTDTGARGFGVNLSTDPTYPFNTDFDGATRTEPWDIGALIAAEGSAAITGTGSMATELMNAAQGLSRVRGTLTLGTEVSGAGIGDANVLYVPPFSPYLIIRLVAP
jgi:hypothetical protein